MECLLFQTEHFAQFLKDSFNLLLFFFDESLDFLEDFLEGLGIFDLELVLRRERSLEYLDPLDYLSLGCVYDGALPSL